MKFEYFTTIKIKKKNHFFFVQIVMFYSNDSNYGFRMSYSYNWSNA